MGGWDSADVVSIVLASTGIGLTAVGLAVVYWQARQARGAAEAAREAATEAREVMARHMTAMELGSIHANLRALLEQLHAGQYESARYPCQESREQLVALRARPGLDGWQERITEAITTLAETQERIESDEPQSALANMESIRAILDMMVELREDALYSAGEGNEHEQRSR